MAIKIPKNLMKNARKDRAGDGKVNTTSEMVIASEEALWEKNPVEALKYEKIETRKKLNWWARFTLSLIIVFTFLFLVWLLFFGALPAESRDLINIMVGAYVAVLAKATDYWFKDKDDPEQKETADINQQGT
ncbi:hypothetical protein CMI37_22775 [Candidatus Pacearchaeota archaeon]|nr:hypothetical protein [Candidatus Pacearchaeota archaeon]